MEILEVGDKSEIRERGVHDQQTVHLTLQSLGQSVCTQEAQRLKVCSH